MGSVSIAADRSRPEDAQTRAALGSRTITNPPLVAASRCDVLEVERFP
jgi:hypothetical protein